MSQDEQERKNLAKNSSKLSLLTLISRVLGLVREQTKAFAMGTSMISDAFTVAFTIPNFMRRLFAEGSITVAFIPTFKGYLLENDKKKTEEFLSATFTVLTFLVSLTVLIGIAVSPLIVKMFGSDPFETEILTKIMFPFLALVSVAAFLQGILNGVEIFTPSGLAPILFNLCFLFVPILVAPWSENPARAMAIAVVVGGAVQALCQLPSVLKAGFHFKFISLSRAFRNPGMRRVLLLIAPTILGMAAYQLNDVVCTVIASSLGTGSVSSLNFSLRLQELILGIFAVSIGTVMLPELTACAKVKDFTKFQDRLAGSMDIIALITIPISVFSALCSTDIVTLLFKFNEFSADSVIITSGVFFYHIVGLYFIALCRIVAPAFYARSDTKSPTYAGIASFATNIVLALVLSIFMKAQGIAFALSIASAVNAIILLYLLAKDPLFSVKKVVFDRLFYVLRMILFSVIAGVAVFFVRIPLVAMFKDSTNNFVYAGIPFVVSALLFAFIGVALLVLTKDKNANSLFSMLKRKKAKI